MKAELFAQLEFLRAHVESVVERSSAILVTSAKKRDGKSLTAHGLAELLADSGRRVVLVSFATSGADAAHARELELARAYPIVTLPFDGESSPIETPVLRENLLELRERFDYTIVDGGPILHNRVAALLAGMVDAVLITVRLGRTSDGDDAALVESLHRGDATVLGVVAVSPKDIATFAGHAGGRHPGDATTALGDSTPALPSLERGVIPIFERSHT